ncbi:PREDICTED: HAUS augmin-like complex subunit 1 [Calidris pugnax]|uniref:HAUS augmin-like complex subunit 1 n=1 Tax=Calidris pugnax TaxID=198806 RepID=UPI00071D99D0|nr:PREDICTED: HAUS augmin-like complex subunit 1 [Calidris pugnax]
MEKKLERAVTWLKKVYGNKPIPEWEVNESTVDFLYNLAECTEARESDAVLLIENMKQKAEEYEEKTEYLEALLREALGLSPHSLSSQGMGYLDVLVASAMALKTKDTSLASFFCAINNMTSELYAVESKNKEMAEELMSMREEMSAVLALEEQLKEDFKKTEEYLKGENHKSHHQYKNMEFLKNKSKDLAVRIKAAEEQLLASGFDPSLTHESLMNLSEEVAKLQKEIVDLKNKLAVYQDLPLSIPLAKVKVEEAKRELKALEEELSEDIEKLSLDLPSPR